MSNVWQDNFKRKPKPIIFIVYIVAIIACYMSIILGYEDYSTTVEAYKLLPTMKVNEEMISTLVGAFPMVVQILMTFMFFQDTEDRGKYWKLFFAGLCFALDTGTDVYYKSGQSWSNVPVSLIESIALFTFGSEFLFVVSTGFLYYNFADFISVLGGIINQIIVGVGMMVNQITIAVAFVVELFAGKEESNNAHRQR